MSAWKFISRNWLRAVDYEGKIRYLNLQWVTQVAWCKDDNEREWVFVKVVGDEYAIGFKAENFPRQEEWEKFLSQGGESNAAEGSSSSTACVASAK